MGNLTATGYKIYGEEKNWKTKKEPTSNPIKEQNIAKSFYAGYCN
ncbi:uncharacterized protein G2W53_013575 [Senna tora]|uniref:Uncharacterized protein n=1 Tax=Senna tora TaxID=362788 RepID=A0A834TZG6_9FABA|nr:uncharacterized protein G2W53_013575 [Senna tora]